MNDEQIEKWLKKQKEINEEHRQVMKFIRSKKGYLRGEKQLAIKNEKERYWKELDYAKQEILGR